MKRKMSTLQKEPKEPTLSRNYWKLVKAILPHSVSKHHATALAEWEHARFHECQNTGRCLCGKRGIVEHNTIVHRLSGQTVHPIGSACIQYFPEEMRLQFKEAKTGYMYEKMMRIGNMTVGWGKYAHLTFYQLARQDPNYAEWLLSIPKYTSKTTHDKFHPDNKIIRLFLKRGIKTRTPNSNNEQND